MTSTREEVEIGYDISNEFFRLWLDERMHYTSAVFDDRAHHAGAGAAQQEPRGWPTSPR